MRSLLPPTALIAATVAALLVAGPAPAQDEVVLEPSGPTPTPSPTVAPSLSVQAERRSVSRAVLDGLRVRTECAGVCSVVRVRVFISPLTARQRRIFKTDGSRHTDEVVVATGPARRDAFGTVHSTALFKGAFARRLAVAKELRIAVEAEARSPSGSVRTAVKRIVLRR